MSEYLVEIFDRHTSEWLYVYVIARSKREARKKICNERIIEVSRRNKCDSPNFFKWSESDFKIRKAYEIHEDIEFSEYRYWREFGNAICLCEDDVFFHVLHQKRGVDYIE